MKKILVGALVGLAAGLPGGWFGNVHFAQGLGLDGDEIEARVLEERREDERLVLMLQAEDETILATFSERPDDVAQLVDPGDSVTIFVRADSPFADDVPVLSVRRGEGRGSSEGSAEAEAATEAATETEAEAESETETEAEAETEAESEAESGGEAEGGDAAPLLTRGRT